MNEILSEDLRDHIHELKALTQSGKVTPIISGVYLVWWGTILTIASLLSAHLISKGRTDLIGMVWLVTITVGWIVIRILKARQARQSAKSASSMSDDITRTAWLFTGVVSTILIFLEIYGQIDLGGRAYLPVFLLCGFSLLITAQAAYEPMLIGSGIGWVTVGLASLFITNSQMLLFLLTAIAAGVFLTIPGLVIALRKS